MQRTAQDIDAARRESEFFDSLVDQAGDFNPFTDRGWNTLKRRFEKMIQPEQWGRKLDRLDIGCGTERSYQIDSDHVRRYVGIDLSHHELLIARQHYPSAGLVHGDGCALPFADDSFDLVCFSAVLHHMPHYSMALEESFRVLRPG